MKIKFDKNTEVTGCAGGIYYYIVVATERGNIP